jgi:hypothetical protein
MVAAVTPAVVVEADFTAEVAEAEDFMAAEVAVVSGEGALVAAVHSAAALPEDSVAASAEVRAGSAAARFEVAHIGADRSVVAGRMADQHIGAVPAVAAAAFPAPTEARHSREEEDLRAADRDILRRVEGSQTGNGIRSQGVAEQQDSLAREGLVVVSVAVVLAEREDLAHNSAVEASEGGALAGCVAEASVLVVADGVAGIADGADSDGAGDSALAGVG